MLHLHKDIEGSKSGKKKKNNPTQAKETIPHLQEVPAALNRCPKLEP